MLLGVTTGPAVTCGSKSADTRPPTASLRVDISVCSPNRSGVDLTAADARALAADLLAAADEMDEAQRTSA
jgi:hypothetical protein